MSTEAGETSVAEGEKKDEQDDEQDDDLDAQRLFVLQCKHCGSQSMTKFGVSLHYYMAGIDASDEADDETNRDDEETNSHEAKKKVDEGEEKNEVSELVRRAEPDPKHF